MEVLMRQDTEQARVLLPTNGRAWLVVSSIALNDRQDPLLELGRRLLG
jgi:hypothetical protein